MKLRIASVVLVLALGMPSGLHAYEKCQASPADGGKVSVSGCCAAGKKATFKATARKGYVFMGWYRGCDEDAASTCVTRLATLVIDRRAKPAKSTSRQTVLTDVDESTTFCAKFVTVEEDRTNIVSAVNGVALEPWVSKVETHAFKTNIRAGVYLEWPVAAGALSATTVRVSGLPNGLKFTAKPVTKKVTSGSGKSKVTTIVTNIPANTIYGSPTAASKTKKDKSGNITVTPSQVKVTVTTAGRSSRTFQIDTTVDPLPSWAVGTFSGPSYARGRDEDAVSTNGTVSVTIAASGKISAKQPVDGKTASFAATCFDRYDAAVDAFYATLTAKVGKGVVTNGMSVVGGRIAVALPDGGTNTVTNGRIAADRFDAWQYNWKSEPWKSIGRVLDQETMTYYVKSDGSCADLDATTFSFVAGLRGKVAASAVLGEDGVVGRVTLKFAASGGVSVSGEFAQLDADGQPVYRKNKLQTVKATGSAKLVPEGSDYGLVFVYLTPKWLAPHTRCVQASWAQHIVHWEHGGVEHWYVCFKPVIYLYPETNTTCRVRLDLNGELTCTYPEYGQDGWRDFNAAPDGTLTFPNGSRYYCLYWEGETDAVWDFSRGFCVEGSETASFLADILLEMGLTFREANEFIIYWLPLMQDNPYNVIAFQGGNYANAARLSVDPQPDSIMRVFMAWCPSDRFVDIPAPDIVPFDRKGFAVVEWGGTKVGDIGEMK